MKTTKDELTQRVLENLKTIQRKKEIQATIEEILSESDSEILDEKSKRGRRQKKRARQQAKKEKAKAAKATDAEKETEAPTEEEPAADAPAEESPGAESEEPAKADTEAPADDSTEPAAEQPVEAGTEDMSYNNLADVSKGAETLAKNIIPQLSTLSKFLLDSDSPELKKAGAEIKGLNKMFDEKLGFLIKAAGEKAGDQPTGDTSAGTPPELSDEQKAEMSPEEIKAYEEKREAGLKGADSAGGTAAEKAAMSMSPEQEAKLKKNAAAEKDPQKKRAIVAALNAKAQVNKFNAIHNTLMQRDKSAFGKTPAAKTDAPDDYYWKKYGPHFDRQFTFDIAKANSPLDVTKSIKKRGVDQASERLIGRGVANGREMLNPAEKEEIEAFVEKLSNMDENIFKTWVQSPKMKAAWKKGEAEQLAAQKKTNLRADPRQTEFTSIYDPKTGELTPEAKQIVDGDVPEWYTPPKGFDGSKYKDLAGGA
jgi:hypothetical protein|tara:strand:+ start:13007 stop:14449 length:1443 start_codon:yes stop_codon:yes gene_type:complete